MAGPSGRERGEGSMWIATRTSFMFPLGCWPGSLGPGGPQLAHGYRFQSDTKQTGFTQEPPPRRPDSSLISIPPIKWESPLEPPCAP